MECHDATTDSFVVALVGAALFGSTAASASSYRLVYSFQGGSDGANPYAGLIAVGGTLYGAARNQGASGYGTVFKVDPSTGAESVVYAFKGGTDGKYPNASLINVAGKLYGTTVDGGSSDVGTVFKVNPSNGAESVVYAFKGANDGQSPFASLINVGGTLYGTTFNGGAASLGPPYGQSPPWGYGTVFKVNPSTGAESVVYAFKPGTDGQNPNASLINVADKLYGTTIRGGSSDVGTVFKVNPSTGAESVVYAFKGGTDGAYNGASLINVGGTLYGTTFDGGASGNGTVFKMNPSTGAESVVYAFKGSTDGAYNGASLINVGGTLYGTNSLGGASGNGTVFKVNPSTGAKSVVYTFKGGSDGVNPNASLINVGGTLYGTTVYGGSANCTSGCGTVFAITP